MTQTLLSRERIYSRVFAVGAFFHLTLPDASPWMAANMSLGLGALVLFVRAPVQGPLYFFAWGACAIGTLTPLVLWGDQLTQSVIMTLAAFAMLTLRGRSAGAIRGITLAVYAIAVFHKLNRDFLNGDVSCASGGMRLLAENWSLPIAPDGLAGLWPPLFIAVELAVVALLWARPAWGVLLAAVMHIPLTIIFAPAFAWVMIPGWVCFFRPDDLAHVKATLATRWRTILTLGLVPGMGSLLLYFGDHWVAYPFWQLNELALWLLLSLVVVSIATRGNALRGRCAWTEKAARWHLVFPLVLVLSAATPYLGLQFHHAGAMLSNLRIDQGCWNHLLVPEAVRRSDPYIRLNDVQVGQSAQAEGWVAEAIVELAQERLWHPASLRHAAAQWCDAAATLSFTFTYQGRTQVVDDACSHLELPDQPRGLFQTNLMRECPQQCIH